MHLDLDNVEGPGRRLPARGEERGRQRRRQRRAADAQAQRQAAQRRSRCRCRRAAAGSAAVTVRVSGPGGFALERSYALGVRPATQILARRTVKPLAKGESLTLSNDLFADLVPGTGSVALSVGVSTALDAAALLAALDRYPFGCSEQIASRALPLLYVNDLATAAHLALDTARRSAHPRLDRPAACASGLERLVRPVVGGRRRRLARRLRHRLPDARARARLRRARHRLQARARPPAQFRRQRARIRPRTAGAISPMRSTCWRATAPRRSAICAISPTPSSTRSRPRSPRRRSPRRSACSATARAPSASMPRRWRRSRRGRCSTTAAPTTARCCATRRRW